MLSCCFINIYICNPSGKKRLFSVYNYKIKHKMNRKLLFIWIMILMSATAFAQQGITISGVITEKGTGEPVIGATVMIKGQPGVGTVTNIDGEYALNNVPSDAVLTFSFVGMKTIEIPVNGQHKINVVLEEDSKLIDEVVVVGYGVQRKSDLTGAVGSVKSEELQKGSSANVANALQGKVSGVIVSSYGAPGSQPEVKIRGIGTTNNSSPLYVVDGMFMNDISFLNAHDIQSMEVLKDASATAIYGSRGANGVIIVTTKRGVKGKPTITISGSEGFQIASDRLKMADASQYAQLLNEALINSGGEAKYDDPSSLGKGTNWFDEIFRTASVRDYQIGLNGGSEDVRYNLSAGFFQQQGVIKKNDYQRFTLRLNNDYKLSDKLTIGHNLSAAFSRKSDENTGVVGQAYRLSPVITPYDKDGNFSDSQNSSTGNPLATLAYMNNDQWDERIAGSAYLNWNVVKGLNFKTSLGIDYLNSRARTFTPKYYVSATQKNEVNELSKSWSRDFTWLWENTLTYDLNINDNHRLNLLGGITAQRRQFELLGGSGRDFISQNENYWYLDQASQDSKTAFNNGYSESIMSYLFRANYTLMDRYLFTASVRADGSSKFGPENRWGYFPSLAAGWRVTEESFLKDRFSWLSNLKLRASWGQIGNDKIGNYKYYALANINPDYDGVFNGIFYPGGTITSLYNRSVHWERSEQYDLGFDLGLFDNRLTLELDYYNRDTRDMLVTVDVPGAVGMSPVETNVGAVRNRGVDFSLNWQHSVKDFNYSVRFTGTTINNKVISLGGKRIPKGEIGSGRLVSMTEEGKSIGYFYGYKTAGIFQSQAEIDQYNQMAADKTQNPGQKYQNNVAAGDLIYTDVDGNGYIDDKDRTYLGSPIPKFVGGLGFSADWHGFDLSVDFQGNFGNKIYNAKQNERYSGSDNWDVSFMDRWTPGNTNTNIPRMTLEGNNYLVSDRYVENGSYVKLQNVELGYTFPKAWIQRIGLQKLRLFASGSNLLYFTKYKGFTPEVAGSAMEAGIDRTVYPVTSGARFGLNITL